MIVVCGKEEVDLRRLVGSGRVVSRKGVEEGNADVLRRPLIFRVWEGGEGPDVRLQLTEQARELVESCRRCHDWPVFHRY